MAAPTADLPAEGSPEGKSSHKDRVLSELRRIKEEYLAAIQDAQAALSGEDPSIGKVLGSQVETLQDYGEVLELAAASGEASGGGAEAGRPFLRAPRPRRRTRCGR